MQPPPLPSGLPPALGGPPPPPMPMPPRAPPPPLSTAVLLTNMPAFLHSNRGLRDIIYPCGSARNIAFFPPAPRDDADDADKPETFNALVTMGHADGALKLLCACQHMKELLLKQHQQDNTDDETNDQNTDPSLVARMNFYMVPHSPNVPMPPLKIDENTTQVLAERLIQGYQKALAQKSNTTATTDSKRTESSAQERNNNDDDDHDYKMSIEKLAAAAGGAYDEDVDPLNAPHVLEAVKEFRRQLDQTQSSQKKRRVEVVTEKLEAAKDRIQKEIQEAKRNPPLPPPPLPTGMPPLPLPPPTGTLPLPPPPPTGLPPPPLPDGTTALPLEPTSTFPSLPQSVHESLRSFIASQIQLYLGEKEATLIDFLLKMVTDTTTTGARLLEELQPVLEEDANVFARALWRRVHELAAENN